MAKIKEPTVSGRDHYQEIYQDELLEEAEWLRRTAQHKVDSIAMLLQKNKLTCGSILELGCGTGAVISECQRRNLAQQYIAVDYSQEAVQYLRANSRGIEIIAADVTEPSFSFPRPVDVIVLSHVIEHLEEPQAFLASIQKNFKFSYLIAEVPLDDLFMGQLAALFKKDRSQNPAGHVQFFTARSFHSLLTSSGLTVRDKRRYVPLLDMDTIRYTCARNNASRLTHAKMVAGRWLRILFGPLWAYLMSAHYAVLCRNE